MDSRCNGTKELLNWLAMSFGLVQDPEIKTSNSNLLLQNKYCNLKTPFFMN